MSRQSNLGDPSNDRHAADDTPIGKNSAVARSAADGSITLEYSLTAADVEALIQYVRHRRSDGTPGAPALPWAWIGLVALGIVAAVVLLIADSRPADELAPPGDQPAGPPRMLVYLAIPPALWIIAKLLMIYRRKSRWQADGMFKRRILVIGPGGYQETTPDTRVEAGWDGLQNIVETPKHLFMMTGRAQGYVVPRRIFDSDHDWRNYVDTVRTYHERYSARQS